MKLIDFKFLVTYLLILFYLLCIKVCVVYVYPKTDYSAGVSTPERFDHFKSKKLASSINSNVEDNSLSSRFDVDRSSKETRVLEDEFTPSYEVEKPQVPYQRNLPNNEEHVQYQRPKFFKFGQSIFRYPSVTVSFPIVINILISLCSS